jgi:hypothetical protein
MVGHVSTLSVARDPFCLDGRTRHASLPHAQH